MMPDIELISKIETVNPQRKFVQVFWLVVETNLQLWTVASNQAFRTLKSCHFQALNIKTNQIERLSICRLPEGIQRCHLNDFMLRGSSCRHSARTFDLGASTGDGNRDGLFTPAHPHFHYLNDINELLLRKRRHGLSNQLKILRDRLKAEDPTGFSNMPRKPNGCLAVETATVVVTNPTHYAVALEYHRGEMAAPKVVAKGVDHMAARIKEIAKKHDVPIVENVTLARALHKHAEIGDAIPADLFGAVAEVLAYLVRLKKLML